MSHQSHPNVFGAASTSTSTLPPAENESRRKMTCRTPSSASSRSTASSSSGVSSANSTGSSCSTEWQQSISIREIHKTGRLCLLVDRKGIFWRHEQRKEPYWCVFCIHEESHPFLELYEDHKSSLTHKPARIISLTDCQHVSPNISLVEDKHSFTITLASEIHQFGAANEADMHDWIATLRTRLLDLQGSERDQNTYTRCPVPAKSDRLLSPEPLFVELPPVESRPTLERSRPSSPRKSPSPRPTELSTRRAFERRPSPLPPTVPFPSTLPAPLASPPACEAPPIPSMPPPVPPRGIRPMRPVPHPLITHIPPPPPPRPGDVTDDSTLKPPRPPRKEDLRSNQTKELQLSEDADIPLIFLADESRDKGGPVRREASVQPVEQYGTLFQRKRSPQMLPTTASRPPVEVAADHKRETRSQTASPALSERSVTSTTSEPGCDPATHLPADLIWTTLPTTAPYQPHTLRQQQVDRLKQEMSDPSGVKVRVRRRDCLTALALVDCFSCVWVAGWKQKEHPHFHSLFHLGDQVLAVNGVYVSKSADVFRLLKDCPEKQHVLFTINRVPRGQVFVLARQHDGQDLGIIREGNTAEIRSALPDGLATLYGLPAKAITCDGSTLCNWVITEINHRPLNWFFKDNEIDDRLNAVGKEISILVQPSDFVGAVKKQLRTIRNYKDFIVQ